MAQKNVTQIEAQMVGWFMSQIEALKYNTTGGGEVQKLTLSFDKASNGAVSIELVLVDPSTTPTSGA